MKFIFNWIVAAGVAAGAVAAGAAVAGVAGRAADAAAPSAVVERAELVMGTVARVALPASAARPETFEAAFAAFRAVDASMSLYRPNSALVRVNTGAATRPIVVDPALFTLLRRARALAVESDGAFDVTILPLLRASGAYPDLSYLPAGSARAVGFERMRLDPRHRTVRFDRNGMGIDLGGIAKGFALDRARRALSARGVREARLDLGGQLAFVGDGPSHVAVRDPRKPDRSLGVLAVGANESVSTSGNYERDFAREGWRAPSHIYDPRTGDPVRADVAVTVWAPDATTADALSTALLVLGVERAGPLLAREPEAGALFVDTSGGRADVTLAGRAPLGFTSADGVSITTAPAGNVATTAARSVAR